MLLKRFDGQLRKNFWWMQIIREAGIELQPAFVEVRTFSVPEFSS
jgi:hypothetical protein